MNQETDVKRKQDMNSILVCVVYSKWGKVTVIKSFINNEKEV